VEPDGEEEGDEQGDDGADEEDAEGERPGVVFERVLSADEAVQAGDGGGDERRGDRQDIEQMLLRDVHGLAIHKSGHGGFFIGLRFLFR